jgi:hypothetical protein
MAEARPVWRQLDLLALEDETTVRNAVGERYQRIGSSIVALVRSDLRCRHRTQDVDVVDGKPRNGAAGSGRQIDREAARPQRQNRHDLSCRCVDCAVINE